MAKRFHRAIFLALLLGILAFTAVLAQGEGGRLTILDLDTTGFPRISFVLIATDVEGNFITDSSGLSVFEDELPVPEIEVEQFDPGTDVIFVIDANSTIASRDTAGGPSRREKVRDSIVSYANLYMDPTQADRVTIVVPDGDSAQFLDKAAMSFPTEVINAVNFYEPDNLGETGLNRMLNVALKEAADQKGEGREQVIVLFTDAGQLADQLDYETLLESALEDDVSFYAAILGSFADNQEISNVARLTEPTGGLYVHMPGVSDADPLYQAIDQRSNRHRVSYSSAIKSSGQHMISARLGETSAEAPTNLIVEAPLVTMPLDNSRPIRRVAADENTPFSEMEPTIQPLVAQVDWPDGYPRKVESASLLVDAVEIPLDKSVLDDSGMLTFDWDIRELDEGVYVLQVKVIDELGLRGVSEPLPLMIEIERPSTVEPAATDAPVPTPAAVEEDNAVFFGLSAEALAIIGGAVVLMVLAVAVIAGLFFFRRQPASPPVSPAPPAGTPAAAPLPFAGQPSFDPSVTYVMPPEFALDAFAGAYLESLENAPEHSALIPLISNNVALGRDPKRVNVVFRDRSVSRVHARIMESHGAFRVYDEGSASGTYVNFERIGLTPRTLNDKDDIHFGRVHVRFHLASSLPQGESTEVFRPGEEPGASTQIY